MLSSLFSPKGASPGTSVSRLSKYETYVTLHIVLNTVTFCTTYINDILILLPVLSIIACVAGAWK